MPDDSPALVKICGTTSVADGLLAQDEGANYIGLILEHPPSPRSVELPVAQSIRSAISRPLVAVTVNLSVPRLMEIWNGLRPAALQLHGDESASTVRELKERGATVWKVLDGESERVLCQASAMAAAGADALLIDARARADGETIYGGTGSLADWSTARALVEQGYRVILAGGLHPENVAEAIASVRPWMVDVVSGVESSKGVKDPAKLQAFIAATRNRQ